MVAVLVVDDEPGVRRLLDLVLREVGYRVSVAADAEAALQAVEEFDPDVVLTDIRLPGMNGMELAERIRNHSNRYRARIVLMSAYGRPCQASTEAFVSKPFDMDRVLAAVKGLAS